MRIAWGAADMKNTKDMGNNTKRMALAAMLSAIGVAFLMIGSVLQVLDISSAAIAGLVIVIAVIEIRGKYPMLIYFAISLISLLILPNRFPAIFFILFGGIYPIFKAQFERFHPAVSWTLKFSMFNMVLWFLIFLVRLLIARESLVLGENPWFLENFEIVVFLLANLAFLLYDIVMTKIILLYIVKARKLLRRENYF